MNEVKVLLGLIREAINQQGKTDFECSFDEEKMAKIIKKQSLVSLIWPVMAKQEDEKWKEFSKKLENKYNQAIFKSLMQQMEIDTFLSVMQKKNYECLPLKGWIMKNYYPAAEMRSMTDFDVLLRDFKYEDLKKIMEGLGYEADLTDDEHHDVYIKKPSTVIELHKRLSDYELENETPQIDEWLDDIWTKCRPQEGAKGIYVLNHEDFYIYHIIHMYKHFRSSGCGIRPLIDIYVFMQKFENNLDWSYLDHTLSGMNLERFEKSMRGLSERCFAAEKVVLTLEEKKLLYFMVSGGLFGTEQVNETNKIVRTGNSTFFGKKIAAVFAIAFPPMDGMNKKYPFLKKAPFLLPVFWIIRIVGSIFSGNRRLKVFVKGGSKKEVNKMEEIFKIAGIK